MVESQCGNSKLQRELLEDCDDGNKKDGDGCSAQCRVEPGWQCSNNQIRIGSSFCRRTVQ